jgi:hypothetical protein
MIIGKNIHNRFSNDDRDLQMRSRAETGQIPKRLYIDAHENDQRADPRCPLGRAGGIEAR